MKSITATSRSNIELFLTVGFALIAFAAGWFSVHYSSDRVLLRVKEGTMGSGVLGKNFTPSPNGALTKARADLVQALRTPGRLNRERAMLDYVAKLDAGTVKTLLDSLVTKPLISNNNNLTSDNSEALSALSHRWGELDPNAALAWLQDLHDPKVQNVCVTGLFDAYSGENPAAALSALAKLSCEYDLSSAEATTISNFAQQDPQAALTALQALPQDTPNRQALENYTFSIFETWAETDPITAAAAALNLSDGSIQTMSLRYVAQSWAQQDPAAALAWANTLPSGISQSMAISGAIQGLSELDPQTAATAALNVSDAQERGLLLQDVTRNWAQTDPAGLLTWADQNLTGAQFDRTALAALNQMGPANAAAALTQLSDPNVVNQAVPSLAANWAQQDPQAALAWAQSLPTDNITLRNSAINGVFTNWSSTDPAAAATYVQQNLATDPSFSAVASHLATTWGGTDPQAALNWAESLPVGAQGRAAVAAIQQMAKADPQSAVEAAQNALTNLVGLTNAQQTALQKILSATANP